MFVKNNNLSSLIFAIVIFIIAFCFRTYNPNWDSGYHLHPDERFLTMVINDIKLPQNIFAYFDTHNSPLNPYNYEQYYFFVYGTFPIFSAKYISHPIGYDTYDKFLFFGRQYSAFFDSLNIIILFYLSKLLFPKAKDMRTNILRFNLAGILYGFTVLPFQLSHFFTVDTFLCFFLLFTFYTLFLWIKYNKNYYLVISGVLYGLAFSSKISAILFSPIILLIFIYYYFYVQKSFSLIVKILTFSLVVLLIFRIFQPYAFTGIFTINPQFTSSLTQLNGILNNRDPYYPPEIQYLNKTPIIYPLKTLVIWGFGIPISILLTIYPFIYLLKNKKISSIFLKLTISKFIIINSIFWVAFLIIYQGLQFTNTVRYFLSIYPFLCLLAACIIFSNLIPKIVGLLLLALHFLYFFAFLNIYTNPHSRILASQWIYNNIPISSNITNEYWDDPLPLDFPNNLSSQYRNTMIPFYDPDTTDKWKKIDNILNNSQYIIMTSNRLWRSISAVPLRYPTTSQFYNNLFKEKYGPKIIAFNSYPGFQIPTLKSCIYIGKTDYPGINNDWYKINNNCSNPGIYLRDDTAEESFTVYDHPQIIIFKRQNP